MLESQRAMNRGVGRYLDEGTQGGSNTKLVESYGLERGKQSVASVA